MKICVIGAGAMGSVFGAQLARSGCQVTLVDRWAEHVRAIHAGGLHIDGVAGDYRLQIDAAETVPSGLGADLAMIWTDANNTRQAAEQAAQALTPSGFAITLQNGIGNVETLVEVLGKARVVAGSSMCSAAMRGPAHASFTHLAMTSVGELDGAQSARIEALRAALEAAGFKVQMHADILSLVWTKFALNCSINALCATTGLRHGELARLPAMDRLQDCILDEIFAVARAKGITLTDSAFRATVKQHTWTKFSRASMLQHIEAGKRTEIDSLNARLVEEGRALGVATPYNDALACLLKGVEHKRAVIGSPSEAEYAAREAEVANTQRPSGG